MRGWGLHTVRIPTRLSLFEKRGCHFKVIAKTVILKIIDESSKMGNKRREFLISLMAASAAEPSNE